MSGTAPLAALDVPGPTITPVSAPFWAALAEGRFVLQRCADCAARVFYPRALCPHCWSGRLDWHTASGMGRLKSWTVVHRAGHPGWQPATPYAVGLVALAEGPTMLSHILARPGDLRLGMALALRIETVAGRPLPLFAPARP